jgi:hypothetical protein
MTEHFASVGGVRATRVTVHVPPRGPWSADCELDEDETPLSGRVVLRLGELELSGTIVPANAGTFGLARKVRIVAGAAGWGKAVAPKAYHNDAPKGVKPRTIAEDAARVVGETIGDFAGAERVGVDYVRQAGPASQALDDVTGGAPWWVDFQGVTHVGPRPLFVVEPGTVEVLGFDPLTKIATLAVDDLTKIGIGALLSERLDAAEEVHEYRIEVTPERLRVFAWCGETASAEGRLEGNLRAVVEKITSARLYGKYRYNVLSMSVDRVNLKAASKEPGLPALLHMPMSPGVPGTHARLAEAAEVFVEFVAGRRADPIITGFTPAKRKGFVPELLLLGTDDESEAAEIAYNGCDVTILLPPFVFNGTLDGVPMTGVMVAPVGQTLGKIANGSAKAKVKR